MLIDYQLTDRDTIEIRKEFTKQNSQKCIIVIFKPFEMLKQNYEVTKDNELCDVFDFNEMLVHGLIDNGHFNIGSENVDWLPIK